jgi:hypothetical protein
VRVCSRQLRVVKIRRLTSVLSLVQGERRHLKIQYSTASARDGVASANAGEHFPKRIENMVH